MSFPSTTPPAHPALTKKGRKRETEAGKHAARRLPAKVKMEIPMLN
jgi:hypothetical protein